MAIYGETATGTMGTSEAAFTAIKVPGGSRIFKIRVYNITGTGVVYQIRIEYSGIKTPQKFLLPVLEALQGTEVGSGTVMGDNGIDVDITLDEEKTVTIYGIASLASQSCVVGIEYTGR